MSVAPERATAGATFIVGCDVTNTGARAGEEVVQLYLRDDYTSVVTFDQELRGFTRVSLAPGETKRVQFEVKPEHLMLYDRDGKWWIEPGRFTVSIGASSQPPSADYVHCDAAGRHCSDGSAGARIQEQSHSPAATAVSLWSLQ